MDLGSLRALVRDLNFGVHGVDAIVTRPAPDDTPIVTRLIWVTPIPEAFPDRFEHQRQAPKRIAALRRDEVPTAPMRTRITAPGAAGEADTGWIVDGTERVEADHVRVMVVPDPEWWPS